MEGSGLATYRADEGLGGLAAGGAHPRDTADLAESVAETLDAGNDGGLVASVVEVRRLRNDSLELAVDGETTTRDGSSAQVLGQSHGGWGESQCWCDEGGVYHLLLREPSTLACQWR
jgi:hypothetical protein